MVQMDPYWFNHEWENDELGSKLYERYSESKTHYMKKKEINEWIFCLPMLEI